MKILLLEDNKEIAENIKEYLEISKSWNLEIAGDLQQAQSKIQENHYDLYVFDVMLPDGESYQLAEKIKFKNNAPIIYLTAKNELEDKLMWFDTWGDDYITKPFALEELVARIENVSKRFWLWNIQILDLDINFDSRTIQKNWEKICINKTERLILNFLFSKRWKISERSDIIEYIWGEDALWDGKSDKKLDVYIANMRKKLWKDLLETVKWVWYKIP